MRDEISREIAQAFNGDLADAVKDFVASRPITSHDWSDNTVYTSTSTYHGRGVFSAFGVVEIDGQTIRINDVKLICLQSELSQTPQLDDVINDMRVVHIAKDPADVSYTLQLRGLDVG